MCNNDKALRSNNEYCVITFLHTNVEINKKKNSYLHAITHVIVALLLYIVVWSLIESNARSRCCRCEPKIKRENKQNTNQHTNWAKRDEHCCVKERTTTASTNWIQKFCCDEPLRATSVRSLASGQRRACLAPVDSARRAVSDSVWHRPSNEKIDRFHFVSILIDTNENTDVNATETELAMHDGGKRQRKRKIKNDENEPNASCQCANRSKCSSYWSRRARCAIERTMSDGGGARSLASSNEACRTWGRSLALLMSVDSIDAIDAGDDGDRWCDVAKNDPAKWLLRQTKPIQKSKTIITNRWLCC